MYVYVFRQIHKQVYMPECMKIQTCKHKPDTHTHINIQTPESSPPESKSSGISGYVVPMLSFPCSGLKVSRPGIPRLTVSPGSFGLSQAADMLTPGSEHFSSSARDSLDTLLITKENLLELHVGTANRIMGCKCRSLLSKPCRHRLLGLRIPYWHLK